MIMPLKNVAPALLALVAGLLVSPAVGQTPGPQAGQKVAFLGDSITQFGETPAGYVGLVAMALEKNGRKIEVIPAGVSGNTSKDILARFKRDVLDKTPDWMTLSCGVNDVWHGDQGVDLETYKKNITSMVDQATAANIKVVILTATMINEDPTNAFNQKLAAYNDFLRQLASDRKLLLADLNAAMQADLAQRKTADPAAKGPLLTVDGVHMNAYGNQMMATAILKTFGITDQQLAELKAAWNDIPGAVVINVKASLTLNEYIKLQTLSAGENKPVDQLLTSDLDKDVKDRLAGSPPKP